MFVWRVYWLRSRPYSTYQQLYIKYIGIWTRLINTPTTCGSLHVALDCDEQCVQRVDIQQLLVPFLTLDAYGHHTQCLMPEYQHSPVRVGRPRMRLYIDGVVHGYISRINWYRACGDWSRVVISFRSGAYLRISIAAIFRVERGCREDRA